MYMSRESICTGLKVKRRRSVKHNLKMMRLIKLKSEKDTFEKIKFKKNIGFKKKGGT